MGRAMIACRSYHGRTKSLIRISVNCLLPNEDFKKPVMILGAPRSGTSLLHRILRGCAGCSAVASEAQGIWRRYTHPSGNAWRGEGWDPAALGEPRRQGIRQAFAVQALPAVIWRRLDRAGIVAKQRRLQLPDWASRFAYRSWLATRRATHSPAWGSRLVEKSVHAGLWPDLVEYVFPDIRFVHLVRDPTSTIESIMRGWREPRRFETYRLPRELAIRDCEAKKWNFILPAGWENHIHGPLADIAAFQWVSIQQRILSYCTASDAPYLQVRLEDLVTSPSLELARIADFCGLPWDDQLEAYSHDLPRVNADDRVGWRDEPWGQCTDTRLLEEVEALARSFGYERYG